MDATHPVHLLSCYPDERYWEEKVIKMSNELQVNLRNRVVVFDLEEKENGQ